ncbi:MAG: hypothetical protein P8R39_04735, partial [Alphaproteobacteria bacterium]|nr:hypothetical protein [Alphaproteobacteria bacterium]
NIPLKIGINRAVSRLTRLLAAFFRIPLKLVIRTGVFSISHRKIEPDAHIIVSFFIALRFW